MTELLPERTATAGERTDGTLPQIRRPAVQWGYGPPPEKVVLRRPKLKPGWPFTALIVLFPLWWALGFMELVFVAVTVPMAWELYKRRPIRLPPGFGFWALFLVWAGAGFVLLGVNPAGTLPGSLFGRMIPWSTRMVEYAAVTVILLYLGNLRESEYPRKKILRLMGLFFLMATAGGLLGMLAPKFEFTAPLELLLPRGVRTNAYVQSLVHPAASQIQDVLGYDAPRPKAPFNYTNSWGNNMAVLGVLFFAGWWARGGSRRKLFAIAALAVAAVPVIYSLNRGVWIGIALAVLYASGRMALKGRPAALFAGILGLSLAVGIVLLSPLNKVVQDRLDNPRSNAIRASLSTGAIKVATHSPILGFGSTRSQMGSPQSITVGRSSGCPRCGNFAIGSAGQMWLLLISTGYVGAALYLGFFVQGLWRYRRDSSAIGIAGSTVVLLSFLFALFYNSLTSPLFITMVAFALLWRDDQEKHARLRELPAPRHADDGAVPA